VKGIAMKSITDRIPSETEILESFSFMALVCYADKLHLSVEELFQEFSEPPSLSGDKPILHSLAYVVWSYYSDSKNGKTICREDVIDWALRTGRLHGESNSQEIHATKSIFELAGMRDAIRRFPTKYPNFKAVTPKLELDVMPWLGELGVLGTREQRVIGKAILKHFEVGGKRGRPKKLT